MNLCIFLAVLVVLASIHSFLEVSGEGVMLIYRPRDISHDCAKSHLLRYDVSFGMGMSDTTTLVFRTNSDVDYECTVEIAAGDSIILLIVIRFPNNVADNCYLNNNAIKIIKKNKCSPLCSLLPAGRGFSPYFKAVVPERFRFRFAANSSINANLNAHEYQVTATAARPVPHTGHCQEKNETVCIMDGRRFCFTSGVVCDGIKNCGATDWFDERKSGCGLPIEKLSAMAVVAVISAMGLALLAAGHFIAGCLPPLANSFFIFNANEDNRLCLDPVLKPPDSSRMEQPDTRRISLIPIYISSSDEEEEEKPVESTEKENVQFALPQQQNQRKTSAIETVSKNTTLQNVTARIQEKLRRVTRRGESSGPRSTTQSQIRLDALV